jgi:hypothetical protein
MIASALFLLANVGKGCYTALSTFIDVEKWTVCSSPSFTKAQNKRKELEMIDLIILIL